jgi:acetyl esterase/lipase
MKLIAIAAMSLLLTAPVFAQTPADPGPPLSGYPRKALGLPTAQELTTATYVRDVIYGHRDGMALTYDVFKPKQPNGALVVNMVSAGWRSSWGPPEERQARYQWLIDKGFTVVALHHASAPRYNVVDAAFDVQRGIEHVKVHAADYGADPRRIGVWGASAGGHLSLVAGLMGDPKEPDETRIRAVVAYFPPTDLDVLLLGRARQGAIDFPEEERGAVSPIRYVDARDPPVLLITGDADRGVPMMQSQRLKEELDRVGVEAKVIAFPGADHDFYVKDDPAKTDAYALEAMNAMVAWFEQRLK